MLPYDEYVTIRDSKTKHVIPHFYLRICCNPEVNGEMDLLRAILKNRPSGHIFDVGAIGSVFPREINRTHDLHLFDPEFEPCKEDHECTLYRHNVKYDTDNVHISKIAIDHQFNTISEYCKNRNIQRIEFLKIDTDGHDMSVLDGVGDVDVDMIQFEYDMHYKLKDLNLQDMFDRLPGWHFFYVLPSGLEEIKELPTDYVYTNIFASKEYPHDIIRDLRVTMKDDVIEVPYLKRFMEQMYWELNDVSFIMNNYTTPIDQESITVSFDLESAMTRYKSIYK